MDKKYYYALAHLEEYPFDMEVIFPKPFSNKEESEKYLNNLKNFRIGNDEEGIYLSIENENKKIMLREGDFNYTISVLKQEKQKYMNSLPEFDISEFFALNTTEQKEDWILNNSRLLTEDDYENLDLSLEDFFQVYKKYRKEGGVTEIKEISFSFIADGYKNTYESNSIERN